MAICVFDPDGDLLDYLRATGRAQRYPAWACYHTQLDTFEHGIGALLGVMLFRFPAVREPGDWARVVLVFNLVPLLLRLIPDRAFARCLGRRDEKGMMSSDEGTG